MILDPLNLFLPDVQPLLAKELSLIRVSRRAMATKFEIALPVGTPNAIDAAEDALALIDEVEDQLTVYRNSSEVAHVNAHAADNAVSVSPSLFQLLELCAHLTQETQGAYDIANGALTKAWGFLKREGRVPTPAELKQARGCSGMRHVVLDNLTVKFRRHGLQLNFGSIGKGYALDRAADLLMRKWNIRSGLLHGGGSSVRAIGTPPGNPKGWAITLKHPWLPEQSLGTVWLNHQGMGTSAATFQHFVYNGKKLGHVLDPRTGWPASGVASATVVDHSAALADARSTACFVMNLAQVTAYCHSRLDFGLVLLREDETSPICLPDPAPMRYDPPMPLTLP